MLLVNGELVAAAEEERFNRQKHTSSLPVQAIAYCLKHAGLSLSDVDHLAISRRPRANFFHKLLYLLQHPPKKLNFVHERLKNAVLLGQLKAHLAAYFELKVAQVKAPLHLVEHHRAHLASAYFVSPFQNAWVVSFDGFGDFASTMWAEGINCDLSVQGSVLYPHSLGIVYTAITQWLGFHYYGDEGKVMGLAPYGKPTFLKEFSQLMHLTAKSFTLNLAYFCHHIDGVDLTFDEGIPVLTPLYSNKLCELLGPSRTPGDPLTEHHYNVASSLQSWLEHTIFTLLIRLHRDKPKDALCLAGGVALNSCVNGKITSHTPFKELYVQPAASDNGTALGAAFYIWHHKLKKSRRFIMQHVYWGPEFKNADMAAAIESNRDQLTQHGVCTYYLDDSQLFAQVAKRLSQGHIIGWFQGRMEFGARALGNRSIVCDPRRLDMKDILNARIKQREGFRPFAPAILREHLQDYFAKTDESPAMLLVHTIRPEKRHVVPAITHVDGTGRLQTVDKLTNPRFWHLIAAFHELTGVPILLNTSFNEHEPIVCTPDHALDCFLRTPMDVLVLQNWLIDCHS